MDNTITINGKEYDKQNIQDGLAAVREVLIAVKEAWRKVTDWIVQVINRVIEYSKYLRSNTPVGLKRYMKHDVLAHHESISKGRSNNWRKLHGLPLRRRVKHE